MQHLRWGRFFLCSSGSIFQKTGKSISSLTLSRTPLFPVLPAFVSGICSLALFRSRSERSLWCRFLSPSLSHAHTNSHFPRKQFSSVTHKKSCLGRAALRRVVAVEEGKRQTTNTERGKRKGNGAAAAAAAIQKKKGHVAHSRLRRKACVFVAVRMCVGVCGLSPFRQL